MKDKTTTTTTTHTPGPWEVHRPHPGQYAIVPAAHLHHSESWTLAYIRDFQANDEANARLIAAAPELLAALRQLKVACEMPWMQTRMRGASCGNDVELAIQAARAAIARAEGGGK